MALAPVVDKLEDVPEPLRKEYVQRDGKFHLELSAAPVGFVTAAQFADVNGKLVEFRDTNVRVLKELDELKPLKDKFKDLDPDEARAAIAEKKKLGEKGIKSVDDVQAMIMAAAKAANEPLLAKVTSLETTITAERKRADDAVFREGISSRFLKVGGHDTAVDFIVQRAKDVFTVENGTLKAVANKFSEAKPGELISPEEWLTHQSKEVAFAFKPSGGGGARPGDNTPPALRAGVEVIKNPTSKQLGDPEVQKKLSEGKVRFEYDAAVA